MLEKAMIMAAGVGSRLGALSNLLPKPIVPLANVATMDILSRHLVSFGIKDVIANTYFKAEDIQNHYKNSNIGLNYNFIKEVELSGTAGGVKKCQFFFDEGKDFIVMSADGLSDVDIDAAYKSHKKSGAIATLVLKEVDEEQVSIYGIVVPDKDGYVESFQEKPLKEEAKSRLANTGIYIFNYKIFEYIPENTFYDFAKNVFPSLLESGQKINTFIMDAYWSDIGSIKQYKQSNIDLLNHEIKSFKPVVVKTKTGQYCAGANFDIAPNAKIFGSCVFGDNCKIASNATIINSVLWNNVTVQENVVIEDSIVLDNVIIKTNIKEEIIETEKIEEKTKINA